MQKFQSCISMKPSPSFLFFSLFTFLCLSISAQKGFEPCGNPGYIMEGNLVNTSSSTPVMQIGVGVNSIAKVGDKGEISKFFEETLFGGNVTGYLLIGLVE